VVELARHNQKKQKKRKRCRYERKHSLSLVHADWLDYDGTQVIAYEDDASRKILSIGEFAHATTENALSVFKRAEDIGGGLILLMRLQSSIITVYMGHSIGNTLKLRMMPLSGK